jgi:hypothetical protein
VPHDVFYRGVCDDLSCPCAVVTIGCTESNPAPDDAKGIPYIFQLDLDAQKVVKDLLQEARPESAEFAKSYVRAMSVWAKSSPTNRSGSLASRATA